MKTSLKPFVLYIAQPLCLQVEQHLCQHFLQVVIIARRGVALQRHEAVVGDVDGRSVAMTRVRHRVHVTLLQPFYIMTRTQHRCHNRQVQIVALRMERIHEVDADGVEQQLSFWNQIRHRVRQVLYYIIR